MEHRRLVVQGSKLISRRVGVAEFPVGNEGQRVAQTQGLGLGGKRAAGASLPAACCSSQRMLSTGGRSRSSEVCVDWTKAGTGTGTPQHMNPEIDLSRRRQTWAVVRILLCLYLYHPGVVPPESLDASVTRQPPPLLLLASSAHCFRGPGGHMAGVGRRWAPAGGPGHSLGIENFVLHTASVEPNAMRALLLGKGAGP